MKNFILHFGLSFVRIDHPLVACPLYAEHPVHV